MNSRILCLILPMLATLPACTSFSHTNIKQAESTPVITKATFNVNPSRGRNDTLMILAFSGGGSRAAYWAASVMFKLQQVFASEGIDMLAEVDAISSVSGGSLPAAYYAISTDPNDDGPPLHGRLWEEKTVKDLMSRNYISRWVGNWFWPVNIGKFWFTAYDRTDIMAQTFADNLYDTLPVGRDLKIRDLNPDRPYLILNATDGTQEEFGSPFTFTAEDFELIQSDINDYTLARAVMGSATFPAVFNYMTLKDYEKSSENDKDQFRHVFDGGNADNLGLRSVKKILTTLEKKGTQYDKLIVILVDAYARSGGVSKDNADTRKFFDFIVDSNFIDATDSLLTGNRAQTLDNFCGFLRNHPLKVLGKNRFIFYPIQFEDVNDNRLRQNLNRIRTNFKISEEDAGYIDEAADQLLTSANRCLLAIKSLLKGKTHDIDPFCHYESRPIISSEVCPEDN
ncbi:Patatin [Nitrosococcus oceani ATCC 19707]|uniref:Patatin n=2 Tax=Nitrosococcus oceani TaxID=1229 RepID=Q3JCB3_NITOC|nr:patatin-like phospholipase family protein [Nitrosococcus oceani]ABA57533.1 Patatin [Nitrosococcus oceani ATCC 19707]KFI20033.1 patatin [Nitrosococcus oceani C-27]GEM20678.1 patatin [Nitrosococcus oceani]